MHSCTLIGDLVSFAVHMKPIAKNNCAFPSLRRAGCLHMDETAWLSRMATDPKACYCFLAHPLRSGKSLMISIFEAMFHQRRELFFSHGTDFALRVPDGEVRQDFPSPQSRLVADKGVCWTASLGVKFRHARAVGPSFNGRTRRFKGGVAEKVKVSG